MARSIAQFITKLEALASGRFRQSVARQLSAEALKQVADGFRSERDPYGTAWAALKHRDGRILQDTGRLRASFAPVETADGFKIVSNVEYAAAQQYGATYPARSDAKERTLWKNPKTGRIVGKNTKLKLVSEYKFRATFGEHKLTARAMIPLRSKGLGPIWSPAFKRIASREFRDALR